MLLAHLANLVHLTSLQLAIQPAQGSLLPAAGPAYLALTASSTMQKLALRYMNLPAGVWSYVCPAARLLPHLTSLEVWDGVLEDGLLQVAPPSAWSAADVSSLATCCPNLRTIGMVMQHGLHVTALQQLTALTALSVFFASSDMPVTQESLQGLAALTQLSALDVTVGVDMGSTLAAEYMLPLTNLTALTALDCNQPDPPTELHTEVSSRCTRTMMGDNADVSFLVDATCRTCHT